MSLFELKFEAENIHTSLDRRENYRMVGFSNDSYVYKIYVILQRAICSSSQDHSIYLEWNGNVCTNTIHKATLSFHLFTIEFNSTRIIVDLSNVSLDLKIINYLESILGNLLEIKMM